MRDRGIVGCLALTLALAAGLSGCAHGGVKVEVINERITFLDKVRFESNKAVLKPESYPLLDQIAKLLKDRRAIRRIKIAGYTDNAGNSGHNLKLSQRRANAVRSYLIKKGISRRRLRARGYGEKRPIASNKTPEGREKNRRVEFIIERRSD